MVDGLFVLAAASHFVLRQHRESATDLNPPLQDAQLKSKTINKHMAHTAQGYKLYKKRDYSQTPSLMEQLQAMTSWTKACHFVREAQRNPNVSNGTCNKLVKNLQARAEELQANDHKERFYNASNQP